MLYVHRILRAVEAGTLKELQEAIEEAGGDMNKHLPHGESLLHFACNHNVKHPEVAIYLMEKYELSPHQANFERHTPLMYACRSGLVDVVEYTCKHFGQFTSVKQLHDENNVGLLHYCFMGGLPPKTRKELVEKGYDSPEEEEKAKLEILKILFNATEKEMHQMYFFKEERNRFSCLKHTVLDLIIINEYEKALPVVLSKGCKYVCNPYKDPSTLHERSIVHWYVETRKADDFFKDILKYDHIDINEIDSQGNTPLHYTATEYTLEDKWKKSMEVTTEVWKEYVRVAGLLVANGANKDAKNVNGETPLCISVRKGNILLTQLLVEEGAYVNSSSNNGETSLNIAIDEENDLITALLLSKDAKLLTVYLEYAGLTHLFVSNCLNEVNCKPKCNFAPALVNFEKKIVNELKEKLVQCQKNYKLVVDELSQSGKTSLHYCCITDPFENLKSFRSKDVIKCLLELGASIDIQDQTGYTPLMYAVKYQLYEETAVLVKNGADPYIENEDGTSAVVLAHGCGDQARLFLNTLRKASSVYGEENNQILQCQIHLNQVCRVLNKQKNMVEDSKQKEILASLKKAEENLQLLSKDPKVKKELQIQNDVLNDNRQKICQTISPEYIYDKLREDG